MVITDAYGLPLAVHTACASPHEVLLVVATFDDTILVERPERLIADRAYDRDSLDETLAAHAAWMLDEEPR